VRIMHQRLRDVPVHWHDFCELVLVLDGASRRGHPLSATRGAAAAGPTGPRS
jgi:hypothetical protein